MNTMTFPDVLRFSLPGGVFIAVALLVYPDLRSWIANGNESKFFEAAVIFAVALLAGTLIQSLHRAVLYVLIIRLITCVVHRDAISWHYLWVCKPLAIETRIYGAGFRSQKCDPYIYGWLNRWADQTHFLWASLWATILGRCLPSWFGLTSCNDFDGWLLGIAGVLLVVVVIDNFRHSWFIKEFYRWD